MFEIDGKKYDIKPSLGGITNDPTMKVLALIAEARDDHYLKAFLIMKFLINSVFDLDAQAFLDEDKATDVLHVLMERGMLNDIMDGLSDIAGNDSPEERLGENVRRFFKRN